MEKQTYELRLYDEPLLRFTMQSEEFIGFTAELSEVNDQLSHLLPLDLELDNDGIARWLKRRLIPKNRAFVKEILETLGVREGDTKGLIDICKGLSLNDSYWIVPENFDGIFAQYNLYENRFSEILSLVAYTGVGQSKEAFTTSPELTTNGMLPKGWRLMESDGIYLYKGGTSGAANTGNEPYSEYYACQIAAAMGLNVVPYDLENWKGMLASKCKLFTDIDTAFVPIGHIVRQGGLPACVDFYKTLGESAWESMCSMLVFDAVIYNEDRHFGNFGILRNNQTGEIMGMAPLFDHGLALFNYAMPSDFLDLDSYALTRTPVYPNTTFEAICSRFMGQAQAAQLRKLIGFRFTRHPHLNLPEERLTAMEQHIQVRVRQLLELYRSQNRTDKDTQVR